MKERGCRVRVFASRLWCKRPPGGFTADVAVQLPFDELREGAIQDMLAGCPQLGQET